MALFKNKGSDPTDRLRYLSSLPRYTEGVFEYQGLRIRYLDAVSFAWTFEEIFSRQVYDFKSSSPEPYIIDCGANIGLAVLYFKNRFPRSRVIGFEPDKRIFSFLERNVYENGIRPEDVQLINKAVYNCNKTLFFDQEGSDAGRIGTDGPKHRRVKVNCISLNPFLRDRTVDFLKIDIEGAEYEVFEDIADNMGNVRSLFCEYHSFEGENQRLDEILAILRDNKFRYYITEGALTTLNPLIRRKCFSDMDWQLNIYAERQT